MTIKRKYITDYPKETYKGRSGQSYRQGEEDEEIIGTDGSDHITARIGGGVHSIIHGKDGNDTLNASKTANGDGAITLRGGKGNDSLRGGDSGDKLVGGDGNDSLSGGKGNDTLKGGDGNDTLRGGEGDDTIRGGKGDDTIYNQTGGNGTDTVWGGKGNDTFVFGSARLSGSDEWQNKGGRTTIKDFASGDKIHLQGDLGTDAYVMQNAGGAVIYLANGHSIALAGVSAADLASSGLVVDDFGNEWLDYTLSDLPIEEGGG